MSGGDRPYVATGTGWDCPSGCRSDAGRPIEEIGEASGSDIVLSSSLPAADGGAIWTEWPRALPRGLFLPRANRSHRAVWCIFLPVHQNVYVTVCHLCNHLSQHSGMLGLRKHIPADNHASGANTLRCFSGSKMYGA